jgi:hypothetical protein
MRTDRSAMRLTGEGIELSLGIVGYQFPDAIDYWDRNWLIIEGIVTHPQGSWRFQDACLTSFELGQLAKWFDSVARPDPDADSGYFTEPCLEFRYASEPEPAIHVILAHECAPPWLNRVERNDGVVLRFLLSANNPRELASAARLFLERFPVRGAA